MDSYNQKKEKDLESVKESLQALEEKIKLLDLKTRSKLDYLLNCIQELQKQKNK